MAITAKFIADFTQFESQVKDMGAKLRTFEGDTAKAGTAVKGLDSDGKAIIGTLRQMASWFGIAFSVRAVVQFGQALVSSADALVDMSTKTGASIEQLQRWASVGAQSNVTMEQFADAAFKLGVALAGGEKSVVRAVEQLGLNYAKLRSQSPDDQFNATVKALEAMIDPQDRNRLAIELFGKSWASIAPAVAKGYSDLADAATVSSDAQVKAINEMSNRWNKFVVDTKTWITSAIGERLLLADAVAKLSKEEQDFILQTLDGEQTVEKFTAALIKSAAGHHDIALAAATVVRLTKDEQAAVDKLAAAMEELNAVGAGWQGTLNGIDAEVVNAVTYYLEAGIAQNTLATAYGLTAAQVKAVASAMDDATKTTKIYADLAATMWKQQLDMETKVIAATDTLSKSYLKLTNEAVLKESAAQRELNGVIEIQVTAMGRLEAAQKALQATKIAGFSIAAQEAVLMKDFGQELMNEAVAEEKARFAAQRLNAELAAMPAVVDPAASSVLSLGASAIQAAGGFFAMSEGLYAAIRAAQAADAGFGGPRGGAEDWWNPTSGYSNRAGGGPVSAGSTYMVGERGPELFRPSTSGSITPNGGGGGITIVVNGSLLSTKAELALLVKDALAQTHMSGGGRMPA